MATANRIYKDESTQQYVGATSKGKMKVAYIETVKVTGKQEEELKEYGHNHIKYKGSKIGIQDAPCDSNIFNY